MSQLPSLFFVFLFAFPIVAHYNPYCDIICYGLEHILCAYAPCKMHVNCGKDAINYRMSDTERDYLLESFNTLRQLTNMNNSLGTPYGAMQILSYDLELEFMSQCSANFCNFEVKYCTRTINNLKVSSVKIMLLLDKPYRRNELLEWAVQRITDRIQKFTYFDYMRDIKNESQYPNALPIMRDDATRFGCGRTFYKKAEQNTMMFVCMIAEGLIKGAPAIRAIEESEVCQKCACGYHKKFKYLCGRIVSFRDKKYHPPFEIPSLENNKSTTVVTRPFKPRYRSFVLRVRASRSLVFAIIDIISVYNINKC